MLYKRGGKWWYGIEWTVREDGKRHTYYIRRPAKTSNKNEAREMHDEHKHALRLGKVGPLDAFPIATAPLAPTLRIFAKRFMEHVENQGTIKAGTQRFYKSCVANLLRFPSLADKKLSEFTSETVAKYAALRLAEPSKPSVSRVNGELRTLRRMLKLAVEWRVITVAPPVHEEQGENKRERILSYAEEARYLSAAAGPNLKDAAILALDTGLRPQSELFQLEWSNVHLSPTDEAPKGWIHVSSGKSKNAERNVPLTSRAGDVLVRRKKQTGSKFVFRGQGKGQHLVSLQHAHEKALKGCWSGAIRVLLLPPHVWHALRPIWHG